MSFVVRTKDDLQQLMEPEGSMHSFRKPRLLIHVPQMADSEARAWEWRLEGMRQDCGCSAGAMGLCVFAVIFVAYALHNSSPSATLPPGAFLLDGVIFVAGLILSAVAGKLIGLWMAAGRFRRTCLQLQERLRILEA